MRYEAKIIGGKIRDERKKKSLSQAALGKLVGVSGKQISMYESGDPIPPLDMMLKLCVCFNCELGYLLGEESYAAGTQSMAAAIRETGLDEESVKALKKISGGPFGGKYNEDADWQQVLCALLSSEEFHTFVGALVDLDRAVSEYHSIVPQLNELHGEDAIRSVVAILNASHAFEGDALTSTTEKLDEAIRSTDSSIDRMWEKEFSIKVYRYELFQCFEKLVNQLYPIKQSATIPGTEQE